ncbi:hypothetical protein JJ691_82910 [Kutzneria sp. CA-103260]|nr:hypothetical protein JJ691_82910 [Kutzneria sp. CA-103260]
MQKRAWMQTFAQAAPAEPDEACTNGHPFYAAAGADPVKF